MLEATCFDDGAAMTAEGAPARSLDADYPLGADLALFDAYMAALDVVFAEPPPVLTCTATVSAAETLTVPSPPPSCSGSAGIS